MRFWGVTRAHRSLQRWDLPPRRGAPSGQGRDLASNFHGSEASPAKLRCSEATPRSRTSLQPSTEARTVPSTQGITGGILSLLSAFFSLCSSWWHLQVRIRWTVWGGRSWTPYSKEGGFRDLRATRPAPTAERKLRVAKDPRVPFRGEDEPDKAGPRGSGWHKASDGWPLGPIIQWSQALCRAWTWATHGGRGEVGRGAGEKWATREGSRANRACWSFLFSFMNFLICFQFQVPKPNSNSHFEFQICECQN
jgi:hypothetical protein